MTPPTTIEVCDTAAGLRGWVAIDSLIDGHAHGGLRVLADVSADELEMLARAMTLKFAFCGLPHGGAKAGLVCDDEAPTEHKDRLLAAFGRQIAGLLRARTYLPGHDMGTSKEEIARMLAGVGVRLPRRALAEARTSSGWFTGLTAVAAAEAAMAAAGRRLEGARAAVEGFGDVGSSVAQLLRRRGCRVVAVSTRRGALYDPDGLDVPRLLALARRHRSAVIEAYSEGGARLLPRDGLHELEVELLMPCARHHSVNAANAPRLQARVVCPGANLACTPEAERTLAARGVVVVPGFVANSGGVSGGTMSFAGLSAAAIAEMIDACFKPQVATILARAAAEGRSPRAVAEELSWQRRRRLVAAAGRPSLVGRAFGAALGLYRHGLLPKALVGAASRGYFSRRLEGTF